MNSITIKKREFEIIEIIKNNTFKCAYKNKEYYVKKYDLEKSETRSRFNSALKLYKSAVNTPKLLLADKKQGILAFEWLDGILISDYILDHDFDENIYRQIYLNSYMARVMKLNLNYAPDQWMLVGEKLFYVSDFSEEYRPENDFTKKQLRLWFLSKELCEFYKNNGILFDKSRIKEDYAVNKETVLMTCKYYQ